ncbi:MAG TPA: cupin domain-containing protein [Gammaproteobacteria bacterium]|nr:cupin domain-containing protein [Gammaproteobacteria bacterium]
MPKLDLNAIPGHTGSSYPAPFHEPCASRVRQRLGDAGGLTDFGVNRLELKSGAWSSQRHWHSEEDEFVYVLSGELVLVTDAGEETLRAGDCAAFPKGDANGHHLINRSDETAVCLEAGGRSGTDVCSYPDIDMRIDSRDEVYTHRDGTPYPKRG